MSETDLELLARYTLYQAEDAFAEIVRRHVDLVHSAALRQVHSPELAEEVAQSTFLKLARHATQLPPHTLVSAWLYQVTRREAIDVVRRESRRRMREQNASEMIHLNSVDGSRQEAPAADWNHIEPLLDEAMDALDEPDRTAVLLRYFEKKPFSELGRIFGTSDDAAQKRVSRALERLRGFLARRGVTVGANGLGAVISTHAILGAPVGLGVAITAAIGGSSPILATLGPASKSITMTALHKSLVAAALVAAIGATIFEGRQAATLRNQVQWFKSQQAPLEEQIQQLERERATAAQELASLRGERDRLHGTTLELLRLRGEVARLRLTGAESTRDQSEQVPGKPPVVAGLTITHVGPAIPGAKPLPGAHEEQVRATISVKIGDPYSRVAIDRDVRALYDTGLFSNVRVAEESADTDIILTYNVQDKPQPVVPGEYVSKSQMAFAGYETPEAAELSLMWAIVSGNIEAATNSFAHTLPEFENSDDRASFEAAQKKFQAQFKGMQILARKVLSPNKVELKIKVDDAASEIGFQQMVKVGNEWKRHQSMGYGPEWDQNGSIQTYTP